MTAPKRKLAHLVKRNFAESNLRKLFVTIFHNLVRLNKRKKGRIMRALKTSLSVFIIALITACGGGGGSPSPAPAASAPSLTQKGSITVSAVNCTIPEGQKSCSVTATYSSQNASGVHLNDQDVILINGAQGTVVVQVTFSGAALSLWSSNALLDGPVALSATCAPGLSADASNFCRDMSWPPPVTSVYKMHETVRGVNQLPVGCTSALQTCWKESIQNGTVKFLETSQLVDGKQIILAVFYNRTEAQGFLGTFNVWPLYAADGSNAGGSLGSGETNTVSVLQSNENGAVVQDQNTGGCFQKLLTPLGWTYAPAECPQF
jgi:hypothetical protein